ncbi:MAG: hypothetical protein II863_17700, partial [Kiritimatiellae bacterium]|nr:hypothetical protein [Kiritimatiellia bacterium]
SRVAKYGKMSFMDSNSAKWGYWGAGCLLDVVVFFVALASRPTPRTPRKGRKRTDTAGRLLV